MVDVWENTFSVSLVGLAVTVTSDVHQEKDWWRQFDEEEVDIVKKQSDPSQLRFEEKEMDIWGGTKADLTMNVATNILF